MNRDRYRFGKSLCGVCGRFIGLTLGGIFRRHVYKLGTDGRRCIGSWHKPAHTRGLEQPAKVNRADSRQAEEAR